MGLFKVLFIIIAFQLLSAVAEDRGPLEQKIIRLYSKGLSLISPESWKELKKEYDHLAINKKKKVNNFLFSLEADYLQKRLLFVRYLNNSKKIDQYLNLLFQCFSKKSCETLSFLILEKEYPLRDFQGKRKSWKKIKKSYLEHINTQSNKTFYTQKDFQNIMNSFGVLIEFANSTEKTEVDLFLAFSRNIERIIVKSNKVRLAHLVLLSYSSELGQEVSKKLIQAHYSNTRAPGLFKNYYLMALNKISSKSIPLIIKMIRSKGSYQDSEVLLETLINLKRKISYQEGQSIEQELFSSLKAINLCERINELVHKSYEYLKSSKYIEPNFKKEVRFVYHRGTTDLIKFNFLMKAQSNCIRNFQIKTLENLIKNFNKQTIPHYLSSMRLRYQNNESLPPKDATETYFKLYLLKYFEYINLYFPHLYDDKMVQLKTEALSLLKRDFEKVYQARSTTKSKYKDSFMNWYVIGTGALLYKDFPLSIYARSAKPQSLKECSDFSYAPEKRMGEIKDESAAGRSILNYLALYLRENQLITKSLAKECLLKKIIDFKESSLLLALVQLRNDERNRDFNDIHLSNNMSATFFLSTALYVVSAMNILEKDDPSLKDFFKAPRYTILKSLDLVGEYDFQIDVTGVGNSKTYAIPLAGMAYLGLLAD